MTDRLSPQREAEIRERAEAATPGPWWTDILSENDDDLFGIDAPGDKWIVPFEDLYEPDAEFMAHARADVPALLAELAAVRAERDELARRDITGPLAVIAKHGSMSDVTRREIRDLLADAEASS